MRRAILHVGTQKTGSTSIQSALSSDSGGLEREGIRALTAGRPESDIAKQAIPWRQSDHPGWAMMATELAALDEHVRTVVISSENLWNERPSVLSQLRALFDDFAVEVVMYVRHQADYLQSMALQHQKDALKVFDFGDENAFALFARQRDPNYLEASQRWEQVFGPGVVNAPTSTKGAGGPLPEQGRRRYRPTTVGPAQHEPLLPR